MRVTMRRRRFLQSSGIVGSLLIAGCAGSDTGSDGSPTGTPTGTPTATPTETPADTQTPEDDNTPVEEDEDTPDEDEETEPDVDRPANYRWDIQPGRNDELRSELGQYIDGNVGGLVEAHPAFEYSTDSERDDHTVDFEALKLYRDSNFDIMPNSPNHDGSIKRAVQAFVDESMFKEAKTSAFINHDVDSPTSYDTEAWLNAETVADSLDLGHNLLISMNGYGIDLSPEEKAVTLREAYKRHHDFDVLAWEVPMRDGVILSGMMYSPDDDKVRTFNTGGEWLGEESRQFHAEIQEWNVINNDGGAAGNPENFHHPVLFHTDEWDREGVTFEDAKDEALSMIYGIGSEEYIQYTNDAVGIVNNLTMTAGATEQLTRTLLDYNKSGVDADFEGIWNLANFAVGKYIDDPELNGVIDTVEPGEGAYDEYFSGGFAFYEVDNEDIVDRVRTDQAHEYDNFGDVYDELEAVA